MGDEQIVLKYWLWLTTKSGLSDIKILQLLAHFETPLQIYHAYEERVEALPFLAPSDALLLQNRSMRKADEILEICHKKKIRIVTMQDAEYPQPLLSLDDAPAVLYVKGQLTALSPAIGVVGTRKATRYGLRVAEHFGYHLSKGGMTVVSGMALGIDGAAHAGALRAGKPTVAVLGCGVDIVYPAAHAALYEKIADTGAIISEFPPGAEPFPANFPKRNRIISGMSLGTLVVEAPKRSGSLITASDALNQGRDVFVIPGNIDAPMSAGCNALIQDGATMVVLPRDILEEYEAQFPVKQVIASLPPEKPQLPALEPPRKAPLVKIVRVREDIMLTPEQKVITDLLLDGAKTNDQLIQESQFSAAEVMTQLTLLEVSGAIFRNADGRMELTQHS